MTVPLIKRKDMSEKAIMWTTWVCIGRELLKVRQERTGAEVTDDELKGLIDAIQEYCKRNNHTHGQNKHRTFEDIRGRHQSSSDTAFVNRMIENGMYDYEDYLKTEDGKKLLSAIYEIFVDTYE